LIAIYGLFKFDLKPCCYWHIDLKEILYVTIIPLRICRFVGSCQQLSDGERQSIYMLVLKRSEQVVFIGDALTESWKVHLWKLWRSAFSRKVLRFEWIWCLPASIIWWTQS